MDSSDRHDWSPADHPYAIGLSQSFRWLALVRLTIRRMRADDQRIGPFSSHQLDAETLVWSLHQLTVAAKLELAALKDLHVGAEISEPLRTAQDEFYAGLKGIKEIRDAQAHFDQWSRGEGYGSQKGRTKAGEMPRDVARDYWPFGYDPKTCIVTAGPYTIRLQEAEQRAQDLCDAIWAAAQKVDRLGFG